MKSLYKIAFLFVLSVFLYSCGCNYHLKKVKRKCGYTTDTIFRTDTLISKEVTTDTVFNYYTKDTVVIREGKLTVKYFYNSHDSTVFLQGKCDADTVVKTIPITVTKFQKDKPKYPIYLFILLVLIIVIQIVRK